MNADSGEGKKQYYKMQGFRNKKTQCRSPFSKKLKVSQKALGLIIGKGGRTIDTFMKTPGISSVKISGEQVRICGDSEEAVQKVTSTIEGLMRLAEIRNSGYYPEFFASCFCKSLREPSLSVNRVCFEKFTGEISNSNKFGETPYFCFRSGDSSCGEKSGSCSSKECSKFDGESISAGFERMAVENISFSHWDLSGYGDVLVSCFQRLHSQLGETMRTIKLIVRFGKDLFDGVNCRELRDGGLVSLSYVEALCRRKHLLRRFSTACSEEAVENLRLRLEMLQYVRVSSRKKISVRVVDLHDKVSQTYNVSVRSQNDEDTLQKAEFHRILEAKDYFQLLGVDRNASEDEINEAYRTCLIKLQYRVIDWVLCEKTTTALDVAYESLINPLKRDHYLKTCSEVQSTVPQLRLLVKDKEIEEEAVISRVRKQRQRHAFVSFCREGQSTTDFRLGVSSHASNMDVEFPEMVEWIENAWRSRTHDQLLVFDEVGRFRILNIRYKETETYVTEDWKLRIARVGGRDGDASKQVEKTWECALSSRWYKWNDGITIDMKSANRQVDALVKEAAKLSEAMEFGNGTSLLTSSVS